MAVNTREKLRVPAGESFGFYASSLTMKLPYSPKKSFWDNARRVHSIITKELAKTNLFRMPSSEQIHPTLLDSLYFRKYGRPTFQGEMGRKQCDASHPIATRPSVMSN